MGNNDRCQGNSSNLLPAKPHTTQDTFNSASLLYDGNSAYDFIWVKKIVKGLRGGSTI